MDRVEQVVDKSEEMFCLRNALVDERPIVLKLIAIFGAEMYRRGLLEATRAAHKKAYGDSTGDHRQAA